MIDLSNVNLLRMSNKLCIIIGKITTFVLLNFTNYVVELMLKFYQSVNSVHCFTYSTFHDPKILTVYILSCSPSHVSGA